MSALTPRAVFVTRETEYQALLVRHATREQARFFLETRGQSLAQVETRHERLQTALRTVRSQLPGEWRQTAIVRSELDRFLFGPDDIVVTIGQDGLVANVAKYLRGQPVIGVNPDPDIFDGVLARIAPERASRLLAATAEGACDLEHLTMVQARRDDGASLLALNEIFVGHRTHQSARYEIVAGSKREFQSSSGLIVASGTGATGWARSIMEATGAHLAVGRAEQTLGYFVREPFPSIVSGTSIRFGLLHGEESLTIISRLNDSGTIFADGIEQDRLDFDWGRRVDISVATQTLNLVRN